VPAEPEAAFDLTGVLVEKPVAAGDPLVVKVATSSDPTLPPGSVARIAVPPDLAIYWVGSSESEVGTRIFAAVERLAEGASELRARDLQLDNSAWQPLAR
jgi:hypothetical protein